MHKSTEVVMVLETTKIDRHTFHDASQGPLGCVVLLTREAFLSLASVGAIITILSLAYDPFLQQILSSKTIQVYTNSPLAVTRQEYWSLV